MEEANIVGSAIRPPRPADAPPLAGPRFEVLGLKDQIVQELRPAFRVLLAAVAFVLLIVCANVANLLLARGTARQREMAVRFAIGASRGRVIRQVLTESAVLACAGGVLGAALGAGGVALVKALASVDAPGIFRLGFGTSILPRGHEVGIDPRMFGIAFGIAALTSLVFGVLPALQLSRTSALQTMTPRGSGAGRRESRIRAALVVGQLMMATVLLVGAGLLVHSFMKLSAVERGYDPTNVLALQLVFPAEYPIARKTETIDALLTRLRANPHVESAGFTRAGILIGEAITIGTFVPQGRTLDEMRNYPMRPLIRPVSARYLSAVGSRLLEGREFNAADRPAAPPVIVISRSVARRYFGAASAVGRTIEWHAVKDSFSPLQVIGVVEDVAQHVTGPRREPGNLSRVPADAGAAAAVGRLDASAGADVDRLLVVCRSHPREPAGGQPGGRRDRARCRSQHRHRRDDSDGRSGGDFHRPSALLRGVARRVRRAWRVCSPRSASTACSRTPSCSGRRRLASAWRSARSAGRC